MDFVRQKRKSLKELVEREKKRKHFEQPEIASFSSPPASPLVSKLRASPSPMSISPIRSPVRRTHRNAPDISPPDTPPSVKSNTVSIKTVESPSTSELAVLRASKPAPKRKFGEDMRRAVAHHKSMIRNWQLSESKSNQIPNLGDGKGLDLIVPYVVPMIHKTRGSGTCKEPISVLAICFELALNQELCEVAETPKLICLKTKSIRDFFSGIVVKLYPPWHTIFAPSIQEEIIYCTEFFKVFSPGSLPRNFNLDSILKSLRFKPSITKIVDKISTGNYRASWDFLRPYSFRSENTITKQAFTLDRMVTLEGVICQSWTTPDGNTVRLLVKDADQILTFIDGIPSCYAEAKGIMECGVHCRFTKLHVVNKITTERSLPLFSVIKLFNSRQAQSYKYYYSLLFDSNSVIDVVPDLDILYEAPCIQKIPASQVSQFASAEDVRVIVEGVLTTSCSTEALFTDDNDGEGGGAIEIRILPSFGLHRMVFGEPVMLMYLRVFRKICTLDQYTIIKRISKEGEGKTTPMKTQFECNE